MESQEKDRVRFSDYIVAYFDVLGQKKKLNQLRKTPTNEQEEKEFVNVANQTYAVVRNIREKLKMGLELYRRVSCSYIDNTLEATKPQETQLRNLAESNYQFNFLSDCFAVTSRYFNDDNQPLIQHVFGLLWSLSAMMITTLGDIHAPVRGTIEIGKAFEWPEGDDVGVYGPIMLDVHELESQIAWYPRIVIGNKLNNSINDWSEKVKEGNSYYCSYKPIIKLCKDTIWTDKDGIPTLDYLGHEFFRLVKPIPQMRENVKLGWEFVSCEYERCKDDKDSQMALKYSLLKEYYLNRLEIWGIKNEAL